MIKLPFLFTKPLFTIFDTKFFLFRVAGAWFTLIGAAVAGSWFQVTYDVGLELPEVTGGWFSLTGCNRRLTESYRK